MINIARAKGLKITAEGVETNEQRDILMSWAVTISRASCFHDLFRPMQPARCFRLLILRRRFEVTRISVLSDTGIPETLINWRY
ncbi:hypothetical protein G6L26_024915 (plasmid) [Agrobacterium radiobacter]|uniref:EAL domain-containing protein n=1 Tax=Agrobacterium tumefaciens str. B6 TaxID=1183423 RepID=A0A822V8Q1_AGRTU|nr:hypothetical protein ASB65_26855 [Agrobacterium tumefaciens str. B6]CVI24914.1 hypothetical protein AGR4A_pAt10363 [Agrobacterium tumefaciens str. B6]SPZ48531.1 Diguanylate cyclase (GGDEF) domain-containing protein [Agrobacterium tumefaciens]